MPQFSLFCHRKMLTHFVITPIEHYSQLPFLLYHFFSFVIIVFEWLESVSDSIRLAKILWHIVDEIKCRKFMCIGEKKLSLLEYSESTELKIYRFVITIQCTVGVGLTVHFFWRTLHVPDIRQHFSFTSNSLMTLKNRLGFFKYKVKKKTHTHFLGAMLRVGKTFKLDTIEV